MDSYRKKYVPLSWMLKEDLSIPSDPILRELVDSDPELPFICSRSTNLKGEYVEVMAREMWWDRLDEYTGQSVAMKGAEAFLVMTLMPLEGDGSFLTRRSYTRVALSSPKELIGQIIQMAIKDDIHRKWFFELQEETNQTQPT